MNVNLKERSKRMKVSFFSFLNFGHLREILLKYWQNFTPLWGKCLEKLLGNYGIIFNNFIGNLKKQLETIIILLLGTRGTSKVLYRSSVLCKKLTNGPQKFCTAHLFSAKNQQIDLRTKKTLLSVSGHGQLTWIHFQLLPSFV